MKKRAVIWFAGLFLGAVLVCVLAGMFLMKGREKEAVPETTTGIESKETETKEAETEPTSPSCVFRSLGNIYYLLPEEEDDFKEQVKSCLKENGMEADTVTALGKAEDDKASPKGTARFYLQLDDPDRSLLEVTYEKETGTFSIAPYEGTIDNIEDYGGVLQEKTEVTKEEPEYSMEGTEPIDLGIPQITDPNGQLSQTADLKVLQNNLLLFLNENQEERRNLYVSSFERTETGYDVVLEFETSRIDGQSIEVRYSDGKYEFGWK